MASKQVIEMWKAYLSYLDEPEFRYLLNEWRKIQMDSLTIEDYQVILGCLHSSVNILENQGEVFIMQIGMIKKAEEKIKKT